ncbi:MAG: glycosyltransferase family 2 protein [Clostridiales bacterium]|nr:glycosyltransferase family 2 protein [Clostridiales bacterium]
MSKLSFVILHYNTLKETVTCVNSIKQNIDTDDYNIIVVDNGSPNFTGKKLHVIYQNDSYVTVLLLERNLGFAKGNNIGINYCREKFSSEYICCMNNDTLLRQKNFYKILLENAKSSGAAVIGPKVILRNNSIQTFNKNFLTVNEYKLQLKRYKKWQKHIYIYTIRSYLTNFSLIKKIRTSLRKDRQPKDDIYTKSMHNVVLHGCCLIFTPRFFVDLKGFDSRTFLYREEELLYLSLLKHGLSSLYCVDLEIVHLEDVATNSIFKNLLKKNQFVLKNEIISTEILISDIESGLENYE